MNYINLVTVPSNIRELYPHITNRQYPRDKKNRALLLTASVSLSFWGLII